MTPPTDTVAAAARYSLGLFIEMVTHMHTYYAQLSDSQLMAAL